MLGGEPPFQGNTELQLIQSILQASPMPIESVPQSIQKVLAKMLAKNPQDRFLSGREFCAALASRERISIPAPTVAPMRSAACPPEPLQTQASQPKDQAPAKPVHPAPDKGWLQTALDHAPQKMPSAVFLRRHLFLLLVLGWVVSAGVSGIGFVMSTDEYEKTISRSLVTGYIFSGSVWVISYLLYYLNWKKAQKNGSWVSRLAIGVWWVFFLLISLTSTYDYGHGLYCRTFLAVFFGFLLLIFSSFLNFWLWVKDKGWLQTALDHMPFVLLVLGWLASAVVTSIGLGGLMARTSGTELLSSFFYFGGSVWVISYLFYYLNWEKAQKKWVVGTWLAIGVWWIFFLLTLLRLLTGDYRYYGYLNIWIGLAVFFGFPLLIFSSFLTLWLWMRTCRWAVFSPHQGITWGVAWSHDGRILATAGIDLFVKLWMRSIIQGIGTHLVTLTDHLTPVRSVAFHSNGRVMASGSDDGAVILWAAASGANLGTLAGHTGPVYGVVFASSGPMLASCSGDQTIKLWSLENGEVWRTLTGHQGEVYAIAVSRNGKFLSSGSADATVCLWSMENGERIAVCTGHQDSVQSVVFSADDRFLLSVGADTLHVWTVPAGKLQQAIQFPQRLQAVAYSPDGRFLAVGTEQGNIWCLPPGSLTFQSGSTIRYDSTQCQKMEVGKHAGTIYALAFSPEGRLLASTGEDGKVRIWKTALFAR